MNKQISTTTRLWIIIVSLTLLLSIFAFTDEVKYRKSAREVALPLALELLPAFIEMVEPTTLKQMRRAARLAQKQAEVMVNYQREIMESDGPDAY